MSLHGPGHPKGSAPHPLHPLSLTLSCSLPWLPARSPAAGTCVVVSCAQKAFSLKSCMAPSQIRRSLLPTFSYTPRHCLTRSRCLPLSDLLFNVFSTCFLISSASPCPKQGSIVRTFAWVVAISLAPQNQILGGILE